MNILAERDSRAVTNDLLSGLHAGRWRPRAWRELLARSASESGRQALARPWALVEVTALHGLIYALTCHRAGSRAAVWTATSWVLSATHLGMLGPRRSLGPANVLTLLRANLPALAPHAPGWLGALALASDLVDGRLARSQQSATAFGQYADSFADAVFWTWYTARREPSRLVRVAAVAAWIVPVAVVAAASFARGRMVDPPRPRVLRPAAVMQTVLAVRAFTRGRERSQQRP